MTVTHVVDGTVVVDRGERGGLRVGDALYPRGVTWLDGKAVRLRVVAVEARRSQAVLDPAQERAASELDGVGIAAGTTCRRARRY